MPVNVCFHSTDTGTGTQAVRDITRKLLDDLIERDGITLEKKVPLKVHFGEKGNVTFVRPENFEGVIEYLKERDIESCYMETSTLYGGQRYKKELHEQTALEHGFTQLPVVFADGEHGEEFAEVEIGKRHFDTFKVGRKFLDYRQLIVLSHFKGHMLSGFGGAIKQLSMGCAAKGGKLGMHAGEKPRIRNRKCRRCNLCKTRCNVDALVIEKKRSWIDHSKCVGCGACMAICPYKAISIFSVGSLLKFFGIGNPFMEKLVEGAYAAAKDKRNIYLNFAVNITRGCDCEPRKMKPVMDDMGIFASSDPVAVDKACFDMAQERGRKFRGEKAFAYAESIGLGSADYTLHRLD
jgi:uncharacterized Fe-S center protein